MFRKMMIDYEQEQKNLESQIRILETELQATSETEKDVLTWLGLIKKCLSLESLDRETAYRLIENISVSEKSEIAEEASNKRKRAYEKQIQMSRVSNQKNIRRV